MSGEIIQVSCVCGVNGSVLLGGTFGDILRNLTLNRNQENERKYRYYALDANLELQELESSVLFEPISNDLISLKYFEDFVDGKCGIECPKCKGAWSISGRIMVD